MLGMSDFGSHNRSHDENLPLPGSWLSSWQLGLKDQNSNTTRPPPPFRAAPCRERPGTECSLDLCHKRQSCRSILCWYMRAQFLSLIVIWFPSVKSLVIFWCMYSKSHLFHMYHVLDNYIYIYALCILIVSDIHHSMSLSRSHGFGMGISPWTTGTVPPGRAMESDASRPGPPKSPGQRQANMAWPWGLGALRGLGCAGRT